MFRRKEEPTIRVCDCGTPLIWTFCWAYAERYCLNCGSNSGMMGGGNDVLATKELRFKKKLVDSIWKVLYGKKGLLPRSNYQRSNCRKCKELNQDHNNHLSAAEQEWDGIATKYLQTFQGFFDDRS